MKLLITGAAGMLGRDAVAAAAASGHHVLGLSRADLDVTDAIAVSSVLNEAGPDVVLNCAASTDVDGAEASPEDAQAVNGAGAGNVARAAAALDAWTIHVSSDYVFDGAKRSPYVEADPVGPLSAYGRSKLAGELAVAEAAPGSHTIVRSSWLFGTQGACFPASILRLAAERDELTVVTDQVGCPTYTGDLAEALIGLCGRLAPGILHLAGDGTCSWYDFACAIVAGAGLRCEVRPCTTADMRRPATRPAYSVLRSERGDAPPPLPDWRQGLADYAEATRAVSAR